MQRRYVAYLRVSTDKQERSGLGLDAQRASIDREIERRAGILVASYVETESGRRRQRHQLELALAACREHQAALIVAKLDRLARDTELLLTLVRGAGDLGVLFCDLPTIPEGPVGKLLVTMMGAVAEFEAGMIADRTRRALAAAGERGKTLGNPRWRETLGRAALVSAARRQEAAIEQAQGYADAITLARREGAHTFRAIGEKLSQRGLAPPGGPKGRWHAATVRRVMRRLDEGGS